MGGRGSAGRAGGGGGGSTTAETQTASTQPVVKEAVEQSTQKIQQKSKYETVLDKAKNGTITPSELSRFTEKAKAIDSMPNGSQITIQRKNGSQVTYTKTPAGMWQAGGTSTSGPVSGYAFSRLIRQVSIKKIRSR